MPPDRLTYEDGDLFPVIDQNLPEGDLFMRLRQLFPKQSLTAMALKLFAGKGETRTYPTTAELLRFGREVCGVNRPEEALSRIAQGMASVLTGAATDSRIPATTLASMREAWESGMANAAR